MSNDVPRELFASLDPLENTRKSFLKERKIASSWENVSALKIGKSRIPLEARSQN